MKLLNSFLIATQSSAGELGSLYALNASGTSSLWWRSETGTLKDLGRSDGRLISSSATYVYAFTGSNTQTVSYTFSKLPNTKYIKVIAVGAGGGGGSGNVGRIVPAVNQGGGGGGGGAFVMAHFSYNQIPGSVTVTLRAPGTGGFAQTAPPTNINQPGFDGQAGGSTTFGSLVTASGGSGGGSGSNVVGATALGGLPADCTPNLGFSVLPGGSGGVRSAAAVVNNASAFFNIDHTTTFIGSAGGGNGGGFNQPPPRARNGSSGSSGYQFRSLVTNTGSPGSASSGATGGNGADNLVRSLTQLTGSAGLGLYGLGGGGHGGGSANIVGGTFQSSSIVGGTGGNGGLYGAGGGGGGASLRPMNSGAGGTGSAGLCIVITYV